jgi:SRSO17 transposase
LDDHISETLVETADDPETALQKQQTAPALGETVNDIAFHRLVDLAKLRWRIGRDYRELKQEVGFGQFEGRGWCGLQPPFHGAHPSPASRLIPIPGDYGTSG